MDIFERLGIAIPIIQAPMAGVSTPALAAAVSNAGALGSIGIGASAIAQARRMIAETRALTDRPFNVNVFCHRPARRNAGIEAGWLDHLAPLFRETGIEPPPALEEIYKSFVDGEEGLELLLEMRPAAVSFHFGIPPQAHVAALRRAGVVTLATATSPGEAAAIEAAGIDAIVAQGIEAGGHRGLFTADAVDERFSMAVLVRLLRRVSELPVIAAGGIMDGHAIRAALDLGACGAQLGTAFILCPESAADDGYRAALESGDAGTTRLTRVFSGRPARGLVNAFVDHCERPESPPVPDYPLAYDAAKQLHAAAKSKGIGGFAAHWAGQGAPLARALPAARLIAILADEMRLVR